MYPMRLMSVPLHSTQNGRGSPPTLACANARRRGGRAVAPAPESAAGEAGRAGLGGRPRVPAGRWSSRCPCCQPSRTSGSAKGPASTPALVLRPGQNNGWKASAAPRVAPSVLITAPVSTERDNSKQRIFGLDSAHGLVVQDNTTYA